MYTHHYEGTAFVALPPEVLFDRLDDHNRLSSHMSRPSWRTAWSRMSIETDEAGGRAIGSHIRLSARILGIELFVDEIVTERIRPVSKTWETIGQPRLLVIGPYRMGFSLEQRADGTRLRVHIDYQLPTAGLSLWLGRLLGHWYARWCTQQMVDDAVRDRR